MNNKWLYRLILYRNYSVSVLIFENKPIFAHHMMMNNNFGLISYTYYAQECIIPFYNKIILHFR